jgi:hypothetical protein
MKLSVLLSVFIKRYSLKDPELSSKGGDKINLGGGHAKGFKAQV